MIKVQTLRLRGLCASSLLALAACSGTSSGLVQPTPAPADGQPMTAQSPTQQPAGAPQGQEPTRRSELVAKAVENARRSLDLRLFEDARNEAAFALQLDNNNAEARDILQRCNMILGDSTGSTLGGRLEATVVQDLIRQERERALVAEELRLGNAHMQEGSYGRAIDNFERAVTALRYSPFAQANDEQRKEAEKLLASARDAKVKADQEQMDRVKQASEQEMARIARDQEIARELRVERILEQANLRFQAGQYAQTVAYVDQALMLDPTNPTATALRDLADRARHNTAIETSRERWRTEWNKTFQELQHSNIPQTETVVFDPVRWAEVSQREPATYTQPAELDTPENQAIMRRLQETVLEHNFASASVQDWASYYAQLTGATFFVTQEVRDMPAEQTTLSDFKLPQRSVRDALLNIQSQTGVAFKVLNGMVHLVSPANAIGTLYLQKYHVQDLIQGVKGQPGPDLRLPVPGDDAPMFPEIDEEPQPSVVDEGRLQDLLKSTIATDKWEGSPFTMNLQSGVLYVRADHDTQQAVDHLIKELRRHVGIQVDVESRFLKVDDSFLEDVGIDLRGLGNQAAQGLPGRGLEKQGPRPNAGFDDYGPSQLQNPARPGTVGTGTEPGVFFDDGGDGDMMARIENLYDGTLGGRNGGLTNAGGLSLQYAFLDDTEVEVVLRAVSKQERSEQIEAPRLLIYNNTRASMHYLRNISYIRDFEVEIAQAAAVANPVIGTVHDGVALDVRPVVDADLKFVTMELRPTVMSLQLPIPTFTTTLGVGQPISIQLPEVTLQRVRTTVTMPDGGTMMLGGMRLVERQNLRSSVPLLGNLPGLSWLFSRKGTSVQNRKILILIRAKIILMEEQEPATIQMPNGTVVPAK
jgi:tetratricopeptide (TPR) repeat protein